MNKREMLKRIIENWFVEKTSIKPTKEGLNNLVDRIHYNKQLTLSGVSQQRELLEAYTKQIKEDNEFTEEITFQDINKCIASNCG